MTGQLKLLHLAAECLWSKHGFVDGSPFDFEDPGQEHDEDPPHPDWMVVNETMSSPQQADLLELLVRRHLLPAIFRFTGETPELVRIGTHHNPIRDARLGHGSKRDMPAEWLDIGVDVTPEQIKASIAEILGESA